jgi:hypothetical protein
MFVDLKMNKYTNLAVNPYATDVYGSREWVDPPFERCACFTDVIHRHLVVMMSIGALRMYRTLVDGVVLNSTVVGVSAKALSTKTELRFASPSLTSGRDEDTRIGNGGLLDTIGSNTTPHRIVFTTKNDEESLDHESTETA